MNVRTMNWFLRLVFRTVCKIDPREFQVIPRTGPLILIGNHINFLEAPVVLPELDNPLVTGLAKQETWDNPLLGFLFTQWAAIPIDRSMVDREAFRRCEESLRQGKILAVSPEGTRSKTGQMLPGKPGVALLALRTGAPLLPAGFYGHENFWHNFKRLRRTEFHIKVGKPFRLNVNGSLADRDVRQRVTDEMMYKIAELLPEQYRGVYAFESPIEYKYLVDDESLLQQPCKAGAFGASPLAQVN